MKTVELQEILHQIKPEGIPLSLEIPARNFILFENGMVKMNMKKCPLVQGFSIIQHGRKQATCRHNHNYFEMMYVYTGVMTHIIDEKRITLMQGDLLIIPPYAYHIIEQCGVNDIAVEFLMHKTLFNDAFMSSIALNSLFTDFIYKFITAKAKTSQDSYLLIQTQDDEKVRTYMNMILCEHYSPNVCSPQIIRSLLPSLFNELYHIWYPGNSHETQEVSSRNSAVFNILSYIEANYIGATLQSVAECFGYTPNYIGKLIKRATKKNFNELRHSICMKEAANLLTNTALSANEISHIVGFSNSSFFYRLFHRYYNMTPNEYREKHVLQNALSEVSQRSMMYP